MPLSSPSDNDVNDSVLFVVPEYLFWQSQEFTSRFTNIAYFCQNKQLIKQILDFYLQKTHSKKSATILIFMCWEMLPIVRFLVDLKTDGYLSSMRMVLTTHKSDKYVLDADSEYIDLFIEYTNSVSYLYSSKLSGKFVYTPYYLNLPQMKSQKSQEAEYIFSGGIKKRDFVSLINAVRGLDVHLKLVVKSKKILMDSVTIPDNCEVFENIPFEEYLQLMADSKFTVVPLYKGRKMHGITSVVESLLLGKPVISTRNASVDDYIDDGVDGVLIEPGDVQGYSDAIEKMNKDQVFFESCRQAVINKRHQYTYDSFAQRLGNILHEKFYCEEHKISDENILSINEYMKYYPPKFYYRIMLRHYLDKKFDKLIRWAKKDYPVVFIQIKKKFRFLFKENA